VCVVCRLFEFDVAFPMDSWLDIEVWDYDLMSSDDIIGSTSIDLENRLFSKHRTKCGLQQKYELSVYATYLFHFSGCSVEKKCAIFYWWNYGQLYKIS